MPRLGSWVRIPSPAPKNPLHLKPIHYRRVDQILRRQPLLLATNRETSPKSGEFAGSNVLGVFVRNYQGSGAHFPERLAGPLPWVNGLRSPEVGCRVPSKCSVRQRGGICQTMRGAFSKGSNLSISNTGRRERQPHLHLRPVCSSWVAEGIGRVGNPPMCCIGVFSDQEAGKASNRRTSHPAMYRLTHVLNRYADGGRREPTNEWRRIKTDDDARVALRQAASERNRDTQPRPKIKRPDAPARPVPDANAHPVLSKSRTQ